MRKLLLGPLRARVIGDVDVQDSAPAQFHENEYIKDTESGGHLAGRTDFLRTTDLTSPGSGSDAMATQYVPYRLIGHLMSQVGEGADDPVISPPRVLSRHPDHQGFNFR